jgi:hypothetical protein
MNRVVLRIVPALIFGALLISSCSKDDINSALSIFAFGQSTTKRTTSDISDIGNQGLWCTGNDIKWYNGTSGELKLKNIPKAPDWTFFKLTIFLDDTELFSLVTDIPWSSVGLGSPFISCEPGEIVYSDCLCGNKQDHIVGPNCGHTILKQGTSRYYISYNYYQYWTQEAREQTLSVMGQEYVDKIDKEKEAFERGWNIFIQQLKKEGKYRK